MTTILYILLGVFLHYVLSRIIYIKNRLRMFKHRVEKYIIFLTNNLEGIAEKENIRIIIDYSDKYKNEKMCIINSIQYNELNLNKKPVVISETGIHYNTLLIDSNFIMEEVKKNESIPSILVIFGKYLMENLSKYKSMTDIPYEEGINIINNYSNIFVVGDE